MGSLKRFINDPAFMLAFTEYLEGKLKTVHRGLEQHTDINALYKLQGQAEAYRRLFQIRDEVNGADK